MALINSVLKKYWTMLSMRSSLLLLFACLLAISSAAQQSSKTKASNKLYEKEGGAVEIFNMTSINTPNLEFSPAYYQNGIVFITSRYTQGRRDNKIDETFFELFYSDLDGNGMPLAPREFSMEVNSQLHEGPVTFDRDGKVMYFTRNNQKKGIQKADKKGVTRLKIYEAKRGPFDWKDIKELPFNSDDYSCAHPSLSADGTRLYFASDMPGGIGGMDLYVCERTGEGWSEPINLGSDVNTEGNEAFPFAHSSGNLFFASNGYPGVGGYDLFMIDVQGRVWGQVTNLGEPFNTPADDLGLILNPEGTRGYFASSREGGSGKDDIYLFEAPDGIWGRTRPMTIEGKIKVIDEETKGNISGADIRIFERTADGYLSNGKDLFEGVLLPAEDSSGEFVFKLIRKDASQLGTPDLRTNDDGQADYKFRGERRYLLLVTKDGYDNKEVVYSTIGNKGKNVIEVELSKSYCAELSGTVVSRTNGQGLAGAIIKIKNTCDQREEIMIADAAGRFSYCLPLGCDYVITGIKETYNSNTVSINGLESTLPLDREIVLSRSETGIIKEGSVIVLESIYYDFNKSYIRKGAAREMDELARIMQQYPSMTIELSSHTDARGEVSYNQRLSRKRAESAKEFLVARGVEADRIIAVGFGESQLRNGCKDGVKCSEEEHQYNRRTEVKVIRINSPVQFEYGVRGPEVIDRKD